MTAACLAGSSSTRLLTLLRSGAIAMIGEDAADRYLITGLEIAPPIGCLSRSRGLFSIPGRSFANLMAQRSCPGIDPPAWASSERISRIRQEHTGGLQERPAKDLLHGYVSARETQGPPGDSYPKAAPIELTAFPVFAEAFFRCGAPSLALCVRRRQFWCGTGCSPIWQSRHGTEQLSRDEYVASKPEWRLTLLRRRSALDSTGCSSCFTVCASDVWRQQSHTAKRMTSSSERSFLDEWNDGNGTLPYLPQTE